MVTWIFQNDEKYIYKYDGIYIQFPRWYCALYTTVTVVASLLTRWGVPPVSLVHQTIFSEKIVTQAGTQTRASRLPVWYANHYTTGPR